MSLIRGLSASPLDRNTGEPETPGLGLLAAMRDYPGSGFARG
jgi:hypothetical protein